MRAGRRAAWRGGRGALHVLAGVGGQSGGGSGGGSRSFVLLSLFLIYHCLIIYYLPHQPRVREVAPKEEGRAGTM